MKRALRWVGEKCLSAADAPPKPRGRPVFLLGVLAGVVACYLTVDWRIGAADAHVKLYAAGASAGASALSACERKLSRWPR